MCSSPRPTTLFIKHSKDGGGPVTEVTLHCGCLKRDVLERSVNLEINCCGDLTTSLMGDQLYGNCK